MGNRKPLKIMLVEDNKIQTFTISKLLAGTNATITHANNGKEAVELCNNEQYDIILMNIKMPVMDGFEAAKEISKFNKNVIIIAQTNYGGIREKCIEGGFNDYIRNPFSKEELIQIIMKNLKE
jgi:CheY-like chemotaxis protein